MDLEKSDTKKGAFPNPKISQNRNNLHKKYENKFWDKSLVEKVNKFTKQTERNYLLT